MAIIEANDIKIYKSGAWRSLKNQKIFSGGIWRTFQHIYKNGNWYKPNTSGIYTLNLITAGIINNSVTNALLVSPYAPANGIAEARSGHVYLKAFDQNSNSPYANINFTLGDKFVIDVTIDWEVPNNSIYTGGGIQTETRKVQLRSNLANLIAYTTQTFARKTEVVTLNSIINYLDVLVQNGETLGSHSEIAYFTDSKIYNLSLRYQI